MAASEVRTALHPLVAVLLGMPLHGIPTEAVFGIFNGRIVLIGQKLYRVEVAALLLGTASQLLVRIVALP